MFSPTMVRCISFLAYRIQNILENLTCQKLCTFSYLCAKILCWVLFDFIAFFSNSSLNSALLGGAAATSGNAPCLPASPVGWSTGARSATGCPVLPTTSPRFGEGRRDGTGHAKAFAHRTTHNSQSAYTRWCAACVCVLGFTLWCASCECLLL